MLWDEKCDLSTLHLHKTDPDDQSMTFLCAVGSSQTAFACCSCRDECRVRKACSFYFGNKWFGNVWFDGIFFTPEQPHWAQSSKETIVQVLRKKKSGKSISHQAEQLIGCYICILLLYAEQELSNLRTQVFNFKSSLSSVGALMAFL